MAHAAGTSARAHRLIGLAATLLLAASTALAFGRVFLGTATTLQLLAAAVAAASLAVALERRSLLLATTASAIGLALAVGLIVFRATLWYGLPTMDTLRAALDAAAVVGQQARIQAAPAEPGAALLLAAVVSLWAAIFSAHALAFRAGSPLLGLIPPVALVAFADTVLEEFVKPLYGVLFLTAAILVVFADGLARVQGWGPVWSSARRGIAAAAGKGARRLGLAALAAAFVAPIVIPGFGAKAVIDFGTPAEDRIAIDPLVSIQSQLTLDEPVEVLRFTADRPMYLRMVASPNFDGVNWRPDPEELATQFPEGAALPGPELSGVGDRVSIDVSTDFSPNWVPIPYPARSVDMPVRFNADTGTMLVDSPLERGASYTVTASDVRVTGDDLRRAGTDPFLEQGRYVAGVDNLPDEVTDLANEWTTDAETDFDRAMAIQEHLRDPREFGYDIHTKLRGGTLSIVDFLTVSKRGFCQQFSSAMAVMLRSLGIPSRVVVGFSTGDRNPRAIGEFVVTTRQAHSWVEVYFNDYGWMPFEPTPQHLNPVTVVYEEPETGCPPNCVGAGGGTGGTAEQPASGPGDAQRGRIENDPRLGSPPAPVPQAPSISAPAAEDSLRTARIALVGAAVVGLLLLLLVPPVRALRRRLKLRTAAAEPRRLILVTYELFTEQATGLGLGRAPGETLEEYRRKVTSTGYLSDGHLDRLTRIATQAAYSDHDPVAEQATEAGEAADVALRELRRSVGPARWLVGLYRRR
jgi:hypothetical protein